MELILIRHGLPLRIQREDGAPADPPLSEIGQRQAVAVGAWLAQEKIDFIYASPLRRAYETATPLAQTLGLEVEVEPRKRGSEKGFRMGFWLSKWFPKQFLRAVCTASLVGLFESDDI